MDKNNKKILRWSRLHNKMGAVPGCFGRCFGDTPHFSFLLIFCKRLDGHELLRQTSCWRGGSNFFLTPGDMYQKHSWVLLTGKIFLLQPVNLQPE